MLDNLLVESAAAAALTVDRVDRRLLRVVSRDDRRACVDLSVDGSVTGSLWGSGSLRIRDDANAAKRVFPLYRTVIKHN